MFKSTSLFSIFVLSIFVAFGASAKTSVWKAEKNGNIVYLGGTVHVLSKQDYPLPCAFDQAFENSDELFFEIDFAEAQAPKNAMKMALELTYTDGRSLKGLLKEETYQKLEAYFQKAGMPVAMVNQFKPGMLLSVMTMNEMQKMNITAQGVDQTFQTKAISAAKETGELESLDEQVAFLSKLGEGEEDAFVNYLLDSIPEMPIQFNKLMEAWRAGDADALNQAAELDEMKEKFPEAYNTLILNRNKKWLTALDQFFEDGDTEYVLVGAAHMVGEDGLLNGLRKQGIKVTHAVCE